MRADELNDHDADDLPPPRRESTSPQPGIVAVVIVATFSGAVLGCIGLLYLMKIGAVSTELPRHFDAGPVVFIWLFLVGCWIVGRLLRGTAPRERGQVSLAPRRLSRRFRIRIADLPN